MIIVNSAMQQDNIKALLESLTEGEIKYTFKEKKRDSVDF
jgi:mannitol-1-phosphate/altronate dehydrogenase